MRIIVAEDSIILLSGLVTILEKAGHQVIGTAATASELYELVQKDLPDLVISDVRMPINPLDKTIIATAGIETVLELRKQYPHLPVLVLSQYVASAYAKQLLDSNDGYVGYMLKERVGRIETFLQALEAIATGKVFIDPEVVTVLLNDSASSNQLINLLTAREYEILDLLATGLSNQEIAQKLFVTEAAVAKHIANIFLKLKLPPEDSNRRVKAVLKFLADVKD